MNFPAKRCVILDWDGTCMSREQVALIHIVDRQTLPAKAMRDVEDIWEVYGEPAINGTISPIQEEAWMVATVNLYIRYKLRLHKAYEVLNGVRLKPGFKRFLHEMKKRGIPVGICSFGIKQWIWYVLYKEGIAHLVSDIFATDLVTWDARPEADPIKRHDFTSMVTPSNKGCWSELFARKYGVPKEKMLAVGDSLGDKHLGCLKENRLCLIRHGIEIERHDLTEHFGWIMASKSFSPVMDWMLNIVKIDEE